VTFCLSKGLCAPVGSCCAAREFIRTARRIRKQLGAAACVGGCLGRGGVGALEQIRIV
jgi:threonine aldolase